MVTAAPGAPPFGTRISATTAEGLLRRLKGRIYAVWFPVEATGVWVGSWSKIIRTYVRLQGERKDSVPEALMAATTEDPANIVQDVCIRTAF